MFVLAGAECGRGEQRGPCAPCPVDTSPVSAPPAAPRRSRACRTPHAEWRRRRQGPARPRAWGRGAGRALPPPPARPPAGGSHRRARTRQMSTACLMSESSGTGSREGGCPRSGGPAAARGSCGAGQLLLRTAAPLPRCRSLPFSERELQGFAQRCGFPNWCWLPSRAGSRGWVPPAAEKRVW